MMMMMMVGYTELPVETTGLSAHMASVVSDVHVASAFSPVSRGISPKSCMGTFRGFSE